MLFTSNKTDNAERLNSRLKENCVIHLSLAVKRSGVDELPELTYPKGKK